MPSRPLQSCVLPAVGALAMATAACGPTVRCENLCARTLACEVTFAPRDDLNGDKIKNGERTDEESCALGCEDNPAVTVESARCVDEATADTTDAAVCQAPVLACFGGQRRSGLTGGSTPGAD